MKKYFLIFIFFISIDSSFSQWVQQVSPTSYPLYDIKFYNNKKGVIVGTSIILITNDSGNTWSPRGSFNYDLNGCYFQSKDSIWAVGNVILKSTDSGQNWTLADTIDADSYCSEVFFSNNMYGWICGSRSDGTGWIKRTSDGGQTWQQTNSGLKFLNDVFFINHLDGWACSEYGQIYKSSDGGQSWDLNYSINNPLRKIFFTTLDSGWTIGGIGGTQIIARTTDGGINWTVMDSVGLTAPSLHGLWFIDSQNGWTVGGVGQGLRILRTTNGGNTWSHQDQPIPLSSNIYFESIYMLNLTTGFIVGGNGIILKTTNSGVSQANINLHIQQDKFELYQNYPNPFNPITNISYTIPRKEFVSLIVYDLLGREISNLVSEKQNAGNYHIKFDASNLSSGVYLYRLKSGDFTDTKKLILQK